MAEQERLCSQCRLPIAQGQEGRIPRPVVWLTAFAFAFMHGGLWAFEELSGPYCPSCRRRAVPLALLIAAVILTVAGCGAWLFLRGPR